MGLEHPDFIVWLLGYPITNAIGSYVGYLTGSKFDDLTKGVGALLTLSVWASVGYLLY